MGPEATASLSLNIVGRCQLELGAKYNSDFPPIITNSCPVPNGRTLKGLNKAKVERTLRDNIGILQEMGVGFVAIPCNSALLPASHAERRPHPGSQYRRGDRKRDQEKAPDNTQYRQ